MNIKTIYLFCDGCAGQNKNYTVFRYLHYCVHIARRFDTVIIHFPVRGHSYLECDKDMGPVNQNARAEIPDEWREVLKTARKQPNPYKVIDMTQDKFYAFTMTLKPLYKASNPIATRPVCELYIDVEHPRFIQHRSTWNGAFEKAVVTKPSGKKRQPKFNANNFQRSYAAPLPISVPKYGDLQVLKRFCSVTNQAYFDTLPQKDEDSDNELSD